MTRFSLSHDNKTKECLGILYSKEGTFKQKTKLTDLSCDGSLDKLLHQISGL